jgi:hypothetical protein
MEAPLQINIPSSMPAVAEENIRQGFASAGLKPLIRRQPSMPMAALEDYMPTAIAALVLTPFVAGFMKKAGEDAYSGLKKGLLNVYAIARTIKVEIVTCSNSPKKIQSSQYSRSFSVCAANLSG